MEEAVNAVSWAQNLAGQIEIARSGLIKSVVEGFQHQLARPKKRKEPLTAQMPKEIVASMDPKSLSSVRLVTLCLLAFAAFLRFNEISQLRCCDVKIIGDKLEVFIRGSKTEQGDRVPIVRLGLSTCPVSMLERYFRVAKIDLSSEQYLFRPIVSTKNGESLRLSRSLSYTRMRELCSRSWGAWVTTLRILDCIVFGQGEPLQLRTHQICQTDCSNAMGDGSQKQQRMAM